MDSATPIKANPRIYALIVAAGSGVRAGEGVPKQYRELGGKPLLRHSIEAFSQHEAITGIQVVMNPEHHALYAAATEGLQVLPAIYGGRERGDSVRAGLKALDRYHAEYVLIHDAARPFLSRKIIDGLLAELDATHAVVPALPVADTVRRFDGTKWEEVSRDGLMRMQTPQAFPFETLHRIELYNEAQPTDEAALWLEAGWPLRYIQGEEELKKMTTAQDFANARPPVATQARRTAVGMGYDVHVLMPAGDKHSIRLGGVDIPHSYTLHGHSDADVVLHAIVDALLGTIGEGDIGAHFPPSDDRLKGADSRMFVEKALERVKAHHGIIQHLDVTIICEQPKVGPHREAMRDAIAGMLHLPQARVSIKATTTEKLGFTGRSEGIAAHAIATVSLPEGV